MSDEINVIYRTQIIVVEPVSGSISIINAGPPGPGGPIGQVSTSAMNQAINNALDLKGLPVGGLIGEVLVKKSNTDYDVGWETR